MDYRIAMEFCEKYINEHTDDLITAQELADITGYSLYHFCHVFRAYFNMSVGEYVRCRALQRAASDILLGKSITDAALDSGFNTSAGFYKAFRKQFGVNATEFCRNNKKRSGDHMKPKLLKKEAFSAIGYSIAPKNDEKVDILESGAYWYGVDFKDYEKYHADSSQKGEIGAWTHPGNVNGDLKYFFGYISDTGDCPEGFIKINVPAAEYAVFDVPSIAHNIHGGENLALEIRKTWKYIFKEWMDKSAYKFDEDKMCFEFYYGKDTQIYVPVKIKN